KIPEPIRRAAADAYRQEWSRRQLEQQQAAAREDAARIAKKNAGVWGRLEDPDENCACSVTGGVLSISMPDEFFDLVVESGKMNAPRVLQPVKGDFIVQMKVLADPKRGKQAQPGPSWQGAGFFVRKDDKTYVRFERALVSGGPA